MLRNRSILFILVSIFIFVVFCLPSKTRSQAWSGLLPPTRAVNWSSAGAGAIPSRTTICQTLGLAGQTPTYVQSVTAAQITVALQACAGTNQTVYLNPGTYSMTQTLGGGLFPSNVTLRGAGPNKTILSWTATNSNCNGIGAVAFCINNGDAGALQYSANVLAVTSGMAQGSTSVTLGAAPNGFSGALSNLHVGSLIAFNELDDASDNGNWYVCGTGGTTGTCSQQGVSNAWNSGGVRAEMQIVTVSAISGSTVTFTPGLYAPNWSSGKSPYATFSSTLPVTGVGIEQLQINTQSLGDIQAMLEFMWTTNSWVQDVSLINAAGLGSSSRKHVEISSDAHITIKDSYLFGSSPSSEGYGIDLLWGTSDSLVQNNICQHIASCTMTETAVANVFGYNFDVDNFYTGSGSAPNWQQCDAFHHDDGDYYNLWEGHEGICWSADNIHGSSFSNTAFRSYFSGRDAATRCPGGGTGCGTGPKTQNTEAIQKLAYARYDNVVANVLGTSGYFTSYQNVGASGNPSSCPGFNSTAIYSLNFASQDQVPISPACIGANWILDNDPLVTSSMVRWGNYDTVSASVQTNSNETASSASTYPGLSSPSTTWSSYSSFYLSGPPSWWVFPNGNASTPWPAVGPDIAGGAIPGVGGHAFHNPAANCFFNVLGGLNDGSSGTLNFDANSCYPSSGQSSAPGPPIGLTGTVVQ